MLCDDICARCLLIAYVYGNVHVYYDHLLAFKQYIKITLSDNNLSHYQPVKLHNYRLPFVSQAINQSLIRTQRIYHKSYKKCYDMTIRRYPSGEKKSMRSIAFGTIIDACMHENCHEFLQAHGTMRGYIVRA